MNERRTKEPPILWVLTLGPFFSGFPALLLMLLGLSAPVVSLCIGQSTDAAGLLRACRNWCVFLCVLIALGVLVTLAVTAFSIRKLAAREDGRGLIPSALKLGAIILFLEILLCGAFLVKGPILSVVVDAQADLQQIRAGELETETMWIYPGSTLAHLPGPYSGEHPSPLTKYYASDESLQSWDPYLFPHEMGFEPEACYMASKPLEWNEENVPRYQIAYTSRLRFVVDVVPVNG